MIVLDATVLIAYLNPTDPHHSAATETLHAYAGDSFATSALTFAETLVRPVAKGVSDRVIEVLVDELDITIIAIAGSEALRLAEIRARTGLKMPDSCVLLAAERLGAARIATFDDRLAQAAIDRGLIVLPAL